MGNDTTRRTDGHATPSEGNASGEAAITRRQYWRKQLKRILILLAVWLVVGYGMSIFFADWLNGFSLGGVPFGFWMAQQGAIFVFISLILIYAISAGRLDERAGVAEEAGNGGEAEDASQQRAS